MDVYFCEFYFRLLSALFGSLLFIVKEEEKLSGKYELRAAENLPALLQLKIIYHLKIA